MSEHRFSSSDLVRLDHHGTHAALFDLTYTVVRRLPVTDAEHNPQYLLANTRDGHFRVVTEKQIAARVGRATSVILPARKSVTSRAARCSNQEKKISLKAGRARRRLSADDRQAQAAAQLDLDRASFSQRPSITKPVEPGVGGTEAEREKVSHGAQSSSEGK